MTGSTKQTHMVTHPVVFGDIFSPWSLDQFTLTLSCTHTLSHTCNPDLKGVGALNPRLCPSVLRDKSAEIGANTSAATAQQNTRRRKNTLLTTQHVAAHWTLTFFTTEKEKLTYSEIHHPHPKTVPWNVCLKKRKKKEEREQTSSCPQSPKQALNLKQV